MKKIKFILPAIFVAIMFFSCGKEEVKTVENKTEQNKSEQNKTISTNYKIEFVELGSVKCIPCQKMQPVMASIEKKYSGLVKVTFHDVWKDEASAKKYGIELIPTQVFLDVSGKELMRHQGFFPEEEIDKFLQSQGVNIPQ